MFICWVKSGKGVRYVLRYKLLLDTLRRSAVRTSSPFERERTLQISQPTKGHCEVSTWTNRACNVVVNENKEHIWPNAVDISFRLFSQPEIARRSRRLCCVLCSTQHLITLDPISPTHNAHKMVLNDPDWHTYRKHELGLRRNQPSIRVIGSLIKEWKALCDLHAYAKCIVDIANARRKASDDHKQLIKLEAQFAREADPQLPWQQEQIDTLWRAHESQTNLYEALRPFIAEQKRIREDGSVNADDTSLGWTRKLGDETYARLADIVALWKVAKASLDGTGDQSQDQQPAQLQRSNRNSAGNESDVAGPVSERSNAGDEVEQVEISAQRDNDGSSQKSSSRGNRKRNHEPQTNDQDERPSKSPRRSNNSPRDVIGHELLGSSDGILLRDVAPFQPEDDRTEVFETIWKNFLEDVNDQDRPDWEQLHFRAQKLLKDKQETHLPEGTSGEAREELRIAINKALEQVVGWDWEEHIDMIKANKDGLYHDGELRQAELARELLIQRAREGRSPEWPPAARKAAIPVLSDNESNDQERNTEIATEIENNLLSEGEQSGRGSWTNLASIGQGAHGWADLWVSVRFGDHGMIAEVRNSFFRSE